VILVRHGQHNTEVLHPDNEGLTSLGVRQAKLLARRLKSDSVNRVLYSPLPRAKQTAIILNKEICCLKFSCIRDIIERNPSVSSRLAKELKLSKKDIAASKKQDALAEKAFHKIFYKPKGKFSREVVVCHGNLIRYFVLRAIGIDSRLWTSLSIFNAAITIIAVHADGRCRLVSHNDAGHIPFKLLS